MAIPVTEGPLNPAHIDQVTHTDTDHKELWDTTNLTFGQHSTSIAAMKTTITALQLQIAALLAKTS